MHDFKITAVGVRILEYYQQSFNQEKCGWLCPTQSMRGKAVRILNTGYMSMSVVCRHGLVLR